MSAGEVGPAVPTIGHWTDQSALTGCTVVLFDHPVLAAVDVRGGAPATRETDLLASGRLVRRADAILLTGGSAFGLAAADGVVRYLAERDRGYPTSAGPVPIVPTAALFDLAVGEPVSPDAAAGTEACEAAVSLNSVTRGRVGAGTGATTSKLDGPSKASRGGVGLGSARWGPEGVTALVAVNAFGDVVDSLSGESTNAAARGGIDRRAQIVAAATRAPDFGTSTTLAVIMVHSAVDHDTLIRCVVAAHDGFARAIRPCHTPFDGDVVFAVGLREGTSTALETLRLGVATELAVEAAILDAITA